jgi:hypothetical protein
MDNLKQLLIPITLILLFYRPVPVNSAVLDAPEFRVFTQDSNGNWKTVRGANGNISIQSGNLGNSVTQVSRLPVPASNGKSYPLEISRTATVDLLKVGSALGSLARKLSPVGMAIGTAAYICSETNICDEAGKWVIPADPQYSDYPSSYPSSDGRWSPGSSSGLTYPTPAAACSDSGRPYSNPALYEQKSPVFVNNNNYNCEVKRISDNATLFNGSTVRTANVCPTGYTLNDGTCVFGGNTESVEPDQAQWDAAEAALNQPASTDHVINNGGDVPVDVSTPPAINNTPISQPIGTTTSTTYDANNNATGTQTKETTLTVTDGATSNAPNQITYNETTIINNYDLNNNLIDSTVTETSAPPPAPPEAPDIDYQFKFDEVSDNDLQDYEFPAVFSQDSWGSGSCPADRSVSYSHGNLELTYQPVCEFAEGIKPAVLVIAGLAAMFIVSGVRTE